MSPTLPVGAFGTQFERLCVWTIMSFIPEEDLNMERAKRCLILAPRFKERVATQNFGRFKEEREEKVN